VKSRSRLSRSRTQVAANLQALLTCFLYWSVAGGNRTALGRRMRKIPLRLLHSRTFVEKMFAIHARWNCSSATATDWNIRKALLRPVPIGWQDEVIAMLNSAEFAAIKVTTIRSAADILRKLFSTRRYELHEERRSLPLPNLPQSSGGI